MKITNPGLKHGYTSILDFTTEPWESPTNPQMNFGILRLNPHESYSFDVPLEKAVLVMTGEITLKWEGKEHWVKRTSFFDENPTALLVPASITIEIVANEGDAELCLISTKNDVNYPARLFSADKVLTEQFGKGTLRETSTRNVRTIFDKNNMPESNLVLGEVINFPGKWSSYPPHGHDQPELYYYRFLPQQGFGFGMDGKDEVKIVREGDALLILNGAPHSQTAAPGYAMYYIWAIRHLEGNPYGPKEPRKFQPEHTWVMDPKNDHKIWPFPK
jgi:5-deoxy-glucuronate isomerase